MTLTLGFKSVWEMLNHLSGREITYWQAYERMNGPLDNSWRDSQLGQINKLLQINTYVTGMMGQGRKNPAPKPQDVVFPWDLHKQAKKEQERANYVASAGGEVILEEGEANPWQ